MDWTKQANDMLKTFTGTQQKVWESWVSSMQLAATPQSAEAWQKTVETWRGTVKYALEQQLELTRLWAESVAANSVNMPSMPGLPTIPGMPSIPGMPANAVDWTRQMLEMTRTWTDMQVRFSENWFDVLKKADPGSMTQGWDMGQAQKIMATWQDAAQKAVEAQTQFSQMMMKNAGAVDPTKK
ncbi:MAG: hypothetical protein EI684_23310 [Candidatus Viridilinea halotolerans]|uniref:Poly(3-hydroxyalkanoate) polymerase subunit PhaE n=1 Tax=Candidatus Viridilinea halotolerans TaxID=2491704 RepID=A0A426TQ83_9CHLR|nr:MAG: hypothetical protein EI684_23310 [Candidatus Viridilinea halotolerans]